MHRPNEIKKYSAYGKIITDRFEAFQNARKERLATSIEILKEGDEDARWMAAYVLGEIGGKAAIDSLISAIKTEVLPDVRCAMLQALSAYADEKMVLDAIRYTAEQDMDAIVRKEAEKIIADMTIDVPPVGESISEKAAQWTRKQLVGINQKIGEHIETLLRTPNLAGSTLQEEKKQLKRNREYLECQELTEYGYETNVLLRSRIEDDTMTLIFQLTPLSNATSIVLTVKIGDIEKSQNLEAGKQRAEFVFEYKKGQQYEIYVSSKE